MKIQMAILHFLDRAILAEKKPFQLFKIFSIFKKIG
jgi:hypothetical protein